MIEEQTAKLRTETYHSCGFVQHQGRWVRLDELLERVLNPQLERQAAAYQAELEARVRREVRERMRDEGLEPAPPATP